MPGLSVKLARRAELPDWASTPPVDVHALKAHPPRVTTLMEDVIQGRQSEPPFFRPSSFGGCKRAQIFSYLRAPAEPQRHETKMALILDTGTALHGQLQGYLAEHPGVFFAPEVPIWIPELEIKGHCDGILMLRKPDQNGRLYRWGVEFKTIGEDGFDEKYGPLPKPDHVVQASIYARLSGVWWISIVYYNKNRSLMKEFPVHYDPQVWDGVVSRVAEMKGHVNRKTLPVYDAQECKDHMTFCRHVTHCHELEGRDPPKPKVWGR
jgi:hypothetical protein